MSDFSLDWLSLREPCDLQARAAAWATFDLASVLSTSAAASAMGLQVLDLGCGSGANLRALAPRLGRGQHWTLVDRDRGLLQDIAARCESWVAARHGAEAVRLQREGDTLRLAGRGWDAEVAWLAADLSASGVLDDLPWPNGGLVTASALLDLVSARWVDDVFDRAAEANCALLFSLSVDGRLAFEPELPGDAEVLDLFRQDQHRDKGFGPALGPDAVGHAVRAAEARGWAVQTCATDWMLHSGRSAAMVEAMIDGISHAALAAAASVQAQRRVRAWREARLGSLATRGLVVGHLDLFGLPLQADRVRRRSRSHITSGAIE